MECRWLLILFNYMSTTWKRKNEKEVCTVKPLYKIHFSITTFHYNNVKFSLEPIWHGISIMTFCCSKQKISEQMMLLNIHNMNQLMFMFVLQLALINSMCHVMHKLRLTNFFEENWREGPFDISEVIEACLTSKNMLLVWSANVRTP